MTTENPYAPRDYTPPDPADLASPEHYRSVRDRGVARCLAALADAGITRDERGKWNVETTTKEKNR